MTESEYKARLLSGGDGAFLFFGDEDYLRRHWLTQTRKKHIPEGDMFDHTVLVGSESISRLADAISQPPFTFGVMLYTVIVLCCSGHARSISP